MKNFLFRVVWIKGTIIRPLLYNFALEYAITKVQENKADFELNGTNQFLAYADDVNLLGQNINTMKKCTWSLLDASSVADIKEKAEKTL
jgi:hypothetical protein